LITRVGNAAGGVRVKIIQLYLDALVTNEVQLPQRVLRKPIAKDELHGYEQQQQDAEIDGYKLYN